MREETLLRDILDYDLLQEHLANGVVRRQEHPLYPELHIYNYSEKAAFDRIWDNVTNVCRGLITATQDGREWIVARGFNKFHNLNTEWMPETLEANLPNEVPEITAKLDGSLGIMYFWNGYFRIATRGSFNSDQAIWATRQLHKHLALHGLYYAPSSLEKTPIFEIIYRENRIVVDYDFEDLVLLGIIDNATGAESPRNKVEQFARDNNFRLVEKFNKTLAECAAENIPGEEGYVLTYPSTGLKVKVKFEDYVRLHRIVTGLNPRSIWEMLAENQNEAVDTLMEDPKMPDGFKVWFADWVNQLRSQFKQIEDRATYVFLRRPMMGDDLGPTLYRKQTALYFQKEAPKLCSVLFAMLDGKDYKKVIWKSIEPAGNATFKKEGE